MGGDDARVVQFQAALGEEALDLRPGAQHEGESALGVRPLDRADVLGVEVLGEVAEDEPASGRQRVDELAHDRVGLRVLDEVQDRHEFECDRPVEVEGLCGLFEDLRGLLQVGVDVVREALGPAGEQGTRVSENHRVVVDVHDPRVRDDPLGDLVDVLLRRQPGADVQELADALFPGQRGHGAPQEVAVVPDVEVAARIGGERGSCGGPVDLVVVLAAEEDVVDARGVRLAGVDPPSQLVGVLAESVTGHKALPGESRHSTGNNLTPRGT